MTRRLSIFTFNENNSENFKRAHDELMATGRDLPEGTLVSVFAFSDTNMPELLSGLFWGDIVQIIDFQTYREATDYPDTAAYADESKRIAGLFSNVTAYNYQI